MAGVPRAPGSPGDGRPAGAAGDGRRVDVLTNNVGETSRKAQARDLAAGVVTALFRVVKLSTLHAIDNQAMVRTIDETVETVRAFCDRADQNVSVLFAHGSIFIGGQLLKASRAVYESAIELGSLLERCGASELHVARDVKSADFYAFATALAEALRSPTPVRLERPSPRIRLRSVSEDALRRGLQVERLAPDAAMVRAYASAVVIMRRFYEDLMRGRYLLPQRVKRIAQRLVDLSSGETPAFLGVTSVRNANHDDAGRAVNTAVLSLAIARQITTDPVTLVRLAMSALLYDTARPRLLGIAGEGRATLIVPQLSDQQQEEVPAGTAVVLTALGRVNEPSVMRTVIAYEAHWLRAQARLGPVYAGLRQATLQARVVATARAFNDMLTPAPGEPAMSADQAIATLEQQATDVADRTVLRLLVGALGIFPTGTLVELSTLAGGSAEVALVVETPADPAVYSQPRVRVILGADGGALERPYEIDLANQAPDATRRHIRRVVATSDDAGSAHLRSFATTPAMSGVRPQQPSMPPTVHLPRGPAAQAPPVSRRGEQPVPSARGPLSRGAAPQPRPSTARGLPPSPPAGARRPPPPAPAGQAGPPSVPRRGSRTDPWTDSPQREATAPPSGYGADRSLSSQPGPTVAVSYGNTQQFPPVAPPQQPVDAATETSPHQSQATRAVAWQQDAEIGDVDIDVDMELDIEPEPEAELEVEEHVDAGGRTLAMAVNPDDIKAMVRPAGTPAQPIAAVAPSSSGAATRKPTATGELARTPLVHLLVYMLDNRLSGTTVFQAPGGASHSIYFDRGIPAKARTGTMVSPLDRVILELGLLDERTLGETLMDISKSGMLHGRHLVSRGLLDRATVLSVLRLQMVRKITHLFELPTETQYAYYQGANLLEGYAGPELTPCEPLALIMTGVRLWGADPLVDATLERISGRQLALHTDADVRRFELQRHEMAIIDALRTRRMTLGQLLNSGVAQDREVKLTLYAMAITRHLDLGVAGKVPVGVEPGIAPPPAASWNGGTSVSESPPSAGPRRRASASPRERVSAGPPAQSTAPGPQGASRPPMQGGAASMRAPRQVSARPGATANDPRSPGGASIREQTPQTLAPGGGRASAPPHTASVPSAPPSYSETPGPRSVRTGLGITFGQPAEQPSPSTSPLSASPRSAAPHGIPPQAMPPSLPQYQVPAGMAPASLPPPVSTTSIPPSDPSAARSIPPASSPSGASTHGSGSNPPTGGMNSGIVDIAGRRMDIEMQAALVDAQDHFELLGVPRTATHEEIQRAYFALAKLWHPDRQPPELGDLREKIARVFSRFNEAYQTLTDATRRMEYLRALEVGTATVEDQQRLVRAVDAALECQKADVLLRKNDLVAAEGYARRAVAADPDQPEYVTVLTWIQAQRRGEPPQLVDGQTSSHYDDLIRILDGVLSKEPEFERALFYRGMLLKRSGRGDIGIRDLRKAAELNPRNIDAVREVRLWNMRKRVGGDADKTGPQSRRTSSPRSPATRPSKSPPKGQPSIFQKIFKK